MTVFKSWNDYFIPGTTTLRNKIVSRQEPYGISDPARLRAAEDLLVSARLIDLLLHPIAGMFDYNHMKAIHQYLFQDVYEWAGQERVAPVAPQFLDKDGHLYYPAGETLATAANEQYRLIAKANYLRGLEQSDFVAELAERWGEINVIHSFREGNTRSQLVFFSQLCEQAGYELRLDQLAYGTELNQEFIAARFHSQDTGSNRALAEVLNKTVSPLEVKRPPQSRAQLINLIQSSVQEKLSEQIHAMPKSHPKKKREPRRKA